MANPLRDTAIPIITAPRDAAERTRYWIENGNELLRQEGRHDLEWKCVNGTYFIEPRRA